MEEEDICENDYPQTILYNNRAGKKRNQIVRQNSGEQLIIASSNFDGVKIC
uniref:WD_REPEATS_REGION domain-containing protein n=1 Tax=Meloidogyne hapla TaxID=6305 RepID=A0A1I8BN76_MELHA